MKNSYIFITVTGLPTQLWYNYKSNAGSLKSSIRSLPKIQSGTSSYCQFLFLMQVISLLLDKLYPGIQSTSTSVLWSTGSDVTVFRPKLRLSDRPVHFSEKKNYHVKYLKYCVSVLSVSCANLWRKEIFEIFCFSVLTLSWNHISIQQS